MARFPKKTAYVACDGGERCHSCTYGCMSCSCLLYTSVSDEVGYGVVPVDAFRRAYREAVGRTCTKLASFSRKVTRVVCGIGTVIKHD